MLTLYIWLPAGLAILNPFLEHGPRTHLLAIRQVAVAWHHKSQRDRGQDLLSSSLCQIIKPSEDQHDHNRAQDCKTALKGPGGLAEQATDAAPVILGFQARRITLQQAGTPGIHNEEHGMGSAHLVGDLCDPVDSGKKNGEEKLC